MNSPAPEDFTLAAAKAIVGCAGVAVLLIGLSAGFLMGALL